MSDKDQQNDISTNTPKQPELAAPDSSEKIKSSPPPVEVIAESKREDTSSPPSSPAPQTGSAPHEFRRSAPQRPWLVWTRTFLQPVIFAACIILFFVVLGVAQKYGWLSTDSAVEVAAKDSDKQYICPMMCVPPQHAPGRCPVCGMKLVLPPEGDNQDDPHAVTIPQAARRVANIQTAAVRRMPISRTIRAIGELTYDESARKTLSAYVDGRVEKLYADYTGVKVTVDDRLSLIYSPRLYTSQVSFLLAKKAVDESQSATLQSVIKSNTELLESSRQRLKEMGMTADQISKLEEAGEADSRVQLSAPISGTVIEKLVAEGQYIKEGQPIYELADLSTVWLMLKLFPEDAAAVRYGQRVVAEVDSLPGEEFVGRVAFIDPNVDPKTRTVGVRVVFPNPDGRLRIGDYAKARVNVPLAFQQGVAIYDPDLANKWISPRHPHVIESEPGDCPLCGIELVPASQYGYTDEP
ncbi:MAG: efflux RND transporter periplasmic adaptor subunit, partial [Pirellulales bacterium]|nr:efflux RND transporter periplasmic adaptor subunit [Pirellulales bacterium]